MVTRYFVESAVIALVDSTTASTPVKAARYVLPSGVIKNNNNNNNNNNAV